jgi:DNA-directed RNA polymerase subunit K/omega
MTYIQVHKILDHIPNKFEAIRVIALECRRINSQLTVSEEESSEPEEKITTRAVDRLIDGEVKYYDARERREEERSEAMLAAAEGLLDGEIPQPAE